ncbi:MAG: leucine-rich repeat domain-containing protein, partial [Oscillibacter sp.]|nr:leucine-rich repeat domain-containing protein [Oscillibacter sp.]
IESELGMAFSRWNHEEDIRILPVEIGNFTRRDWIWYYLIHTQSVKFPTEPDEERLQGLVKQVAKLLGKDLASQQKPKPSPPPVQTPPPKPSPPPAKIIKRGECGDNVTYTLDENGVLTISGTGPMWNFEYISDNPWFGERETITHIEIQYDVTTIGAGAFWCFTGLISVTIPHSVTNIGLGAFFGCICLVGVTIPDGVTMIEKGAFLNCTSLESVSVPAKAKIGDMAFPPTVRIERRT